MAKIKKPKQAANLARAIWRLHGQCENCGKTANEGKLDGAHYLGVGAFFRIQADLRNGFCLCFTCHRLFHDDHLAFDNFVNTNGRWILDYDSALRALARPDSGPKIDWDERLEFLKDVKRAMEAGELTIEEARAYEL